MTDLVIGDQMGQATLESCAEADALAPGVASVAPRAKTTIPTTFKTSDFHAMVAAGFTFSPDTMIWQHDKTGWKCSSEEVGVNGAEATIRRHQDTLTAQAANQAPGALADATFIAPGGHETATAEGMVFHPREEPQRAQSAYPRRCATWCGLPFGDKRVPVNFAFSATKEFTLESPAYCCPQRPEDMGP